MSEIATQLSAFLPEGVSLGVASILVIISFFTSATTACFGIGGGVLMLASMGLFLPVSALIPVQGLVQLGSNTGRAYVQRAHVQWQFMKPFLIGSVIGAGIGGLVVVQLPDAAMKIVLGLFILIITWVNIPGLGKLKGFAFTLVSGGIAFLSMFLGATGPLTAAVLAALIPDNRKALIATSAVALMVHHGLKVLVFGLLGFAFRQWLPLIVTMIATGYLGTLTGSALLSRIPEATFRLVFKLISSALALHMLWAGMGLAAST
ncbi:MAG: sulfite exporter TauE/SafE family protein [Rhizobiaceae bacterium]